MNPLGWLGNKTSRKNTQNSEFLICKPPDGILWRQILGQMPAKSPFPALGNLILQIMTTMNI